MKRIAGLMSFWEKNEAPRDARTRAQMAAAEVEAVRSVAQRMLRGEDFSPLRLAHEIERKALAVFHGELLLGGEALPELSAEPLQLLLDAVKFLHRKAWNGAAWTLSTQEQRETIAAEFAEYLRLPRDVANERHERRNELIYR